MGEVPVPRAEPMAPLESAHLWTRRVLLAGLVLYLPLTGVLWLLTPLGPGHAFFLAVLLELAPVLAVGQLRLLEAGLPPRLQAYGASAAGIGILGLFSLVLGARLPGPGVPFLPAAPIELAAWSAALSAAALGLMVGMAVLRRRLGIRESPILEALLPRSRAERWAFAGLSGVAGFGEELAYRGYALAALATATGSWTVAAAVSSAVFGCLHVYQGVYGVVRTGLLGLLLVVGVLASGALAPAVAAHVVVDLVGGLVLGDRLLQD